MQVFCRKITTLKKHTRSWFDATRYVPVTYADTSALERDFGYKPSTSLREGFTESSLSGTQKFYK